MLDNNSTCLKSAVNELIQRENQELGIRVTSICPGVVFTPLIEHWPNLVYENCLYPEDIADLVMWLLTRRPNVKIGRPILIQTMLNPWKKLEDSISASPISYQL